MVFAPDLVRVVPPTGNLWGLFVDADELRCEPYDDGTFIVGATRASIAYSGGATVEGAVTMIHEDSEALVGPGSFVFKAGASSPATSIVVWDVEGAALHTRTLTAGDRCTTPVYLGGWLYWFEWAIAIEFTPKTVSFRRSRADLSSLTELETFDLSEVNGNVGGALIELVLPLEGNIVFSWRTGNEDGHDQLAFYSKALSIGAPADNTADWALAFGIRESVDSAPYLDGSAVGAGLWDPVEEFCYFSADFNTAHASDFDGGFRGRLQRTINTIGASTVWANNAGLWDVGGAASIDVAGDFALAYGGGLIRHDRSLPVIAGDPLFSGAVDSHPDLEVSPVGMFFVIA